MPSSLMHARRHEERTFAGAHPRGGKSMLRAAAADVMVFRRA
jgi:hypothetical protein